MYHLARFVDKVVTSIQMLGLYGGIAGGILGLLGGLVGTCLSIGRANGAGERVWIIQVAVAFWVAITLSLVGLWSMPRPYQCLLWLPWLLLVIRGDPTLNQKHAEIRQHDVSGNA